MTVLQPFDYQHAGVALQGQLARPPGGGSRPGVLVMHDARGLGENARKRALRLAEAGYIALATDMYGGGRCFDDPQEGGVHYVALQNEPQKLRARVLAAFDALRAVQGVDAARIGAIGFCFGGQCVLELARSGAEAKSVVSFHGTLATQLPAQAGQVKAKMLVLTGAHDPYAPMEHVQDFQKEMTDAAADWQLTIYSEGWHAFTDPNLDGLKGVQGLRYDPLLDRLSWAQATAFLDATLRA